MKYRIVEVQTNDDELRKHLTNPYYRVEKRAPLISNEIWSLVKACSTLKEAEAYMESIKPEYEKVVREYEV